MIIKVKVWQAALISLLLVAIPFAAGWMIGAVYSFDVGHKTALIEVGAALREQLQDGKSFNLRHIEGIKFYPRKGGGINYKREFTIAGAGSDRPAKTWPQARESGQ